MSYQTRESKSRHYAFIHYCEPYLFLSAVSEQTSVSRYITIYHDKDLKEDGSPKEPHFHTILTFENPHYLAGVSRMCRTLLEGDNSTVLVEPVHDKCQAFLYLTHETEECIEEGKPLYDPSLLLSNDLPYYQQWALSDGDNERTTEHFICDLLTLTPFQMALKWGRDYIKNFNKYREFINFAVSSNLDDLPLSITNILKGVNQNET